MAMNAEHPKWGGAREGAGRKRGSGTGRKKEFQSTSVSGTPQEIAVLKAAAAKAGKSVSRYVLDWVLSQEGGQ